ncbi:hypothetical protein HDU93_003090, partial [Gonapodya sp. JEL0774]
WAGFGLTRNGTSTMETIDAYLYEPGSNATVKVGDRALNTNDSMDLVIGPGIITIAFAWSGSAKSTASYHGSTSRLKMQLDFYKNRTGTGTSGGSLA